MEKDGFLGLFYALKELHVNKKKHTKTALKRIVKNPKNPKHIMLSGKNFSYNMGEAGKVPLHLSPYASENSNYSFVSVEDAISNIMRQFKSNYHAAKEKGLTAQLFQNVSSAIQCLDARRESIATWIARKSKDKMDLHTAILDFLNEFAEDFGEENFMGPDQRWADLASREDIYLEDILKHILKNHEGYECLDGEVLDSKSITNYLDLFLGIENRP